MGTISSTRLLKTRNDYSLTVIKAEHLPTNVIYISMLHNNFNIRIYKISAYIYKRSYKLIIIQDYSYLQT